MKKLIIFLFLLPLFLQAQTFPNSTKQQGKKDFMDYSRFRKKVQFLDDSIRFNAIPHDATPDSILTFEGGIVKRSAIPDSVELSTVAVMLADSSGVAAGSYTTGKDFAVGQALKVAYSDTSTMLTPYARKHNPVFTGIQKVSTTDTLSTKAYARSVGESYDSIRVLNATPTTGNVYINSVNKKLYYLAGNYWHRVAILDSIKVASSIPAIIAGDGHTVGWYIASDVSNITKDGSNYVSLWKDTLASGHDLVADEEATPLYKPTWASTGITFDGTKNFLKTATFTLNQPEFIYMVVKVYSDCIDYSYISGGYTTDVGAIITIPSTTDIHLRCGSASNFDYTMLFDEYVIIRVLFSGTSSFSKINGDAATTGTTGTTAMSGFTLGCDIKNAGASHIKVKEIIIRNSNDSGDDETAIYNYLKARYGL